MSQLRTVNHQQPVAGPASSLTSVSSAVHSATITPESARVALRLSQASVLLAWAILLFSIFTAIAMAYVVYETYTPVIFWDQWTIVNDLIQSHGHPSIRQVWSQHNEHRIPFGRLACYADLKFFKGKNVSLIVEIFIVQAFEALLLTWMFRRYSGLAKAAKITAAGFFTFFMFYPISI